MIGKPAQPPIIGFSVRLYEACLTAYPASFRRKYGREMTLLFRDCCMRAIRQNGTDGMARLWAITLLDLIQSVISEHAHKETQMKKEMKPADIRRAGWALILGAVLFVLSVLIPSSSSSAAGAAVPLLVFASMPLLVYGMLGLRARFGERAGGFGSTMLLIGAILGPIVSLIGLILGATDMLWIIPWTGPAVLFSGLVFFGVAALTTKALPRWNGLPILAGFPYPALLLSIMVPVLLTGDWSIFDTLEKLVVPLIAGQGVALIALGYILRSGLPEQAAATA